MFSLDESGFIPKQDQSQLPEANPSGDCIGSKLIYLFNNTIVTSRQVNVDDTAFVQVVERNPKRLYWQFGGDDTNQDYYLRYEFGDTNILQRYSFAVGTITSFYYEKHGVLVCQAAFLRRAIAAAGNVQIIETIYTG